MQPYLTITPHAIQSHPIPHLHYTITSLQILALFPSLILALQSPRIQVELPILFPRPVSTNARRWRKTTKTNQPFPTQAHFLHTCLLFHFHAGAIFLVSYVFSGGLRVIKLYCIGSIKKNQKEKNDKEKEKEKKEKITCKALRQQV